MIKRTQAGLYVPATAGIGRRNFLTGAAALGAGAALAGSLPGTAFGQPKQGGTLRMALGHGSTTDSLDPATFENDFMIASDYTLNNHIGEVDETGEIKPELAEWSASDDARIWTFRVRDGVKFHNGKTLEAADFVASINHHRKEDSKSPAKSLLSPVERVEAKDPKTFVIELNAGNADLPYIVSDYHIAILPVDGNGELDPTSGIGCGPYKLESWEPGVRISFSRNEQYWKQNRAHFDAVELIVAHDAAARTNALTTGEVDAIDRVDLKTVSLMKRRPNVRVEEVVGFRHYTFAMRTDTPPFDDNNVRMALKLSLDRNEVLEKILQGHGRVGNDHPISPKNRFHADLPQRTYDPEKAKWHLKQAGMENLTVPLHASEAAFPGSVDAGVLYKEQAQKAGITIDVKREPSDGYWADVWMKEPWTAVYWSGRVTSDWMFTTAYAADANWNDTFWKHDRFNKLLVEARATLDPDKRAEMYAEMQRLVRNQGGVVVPMFANYVFAMSDQVQHDGTLAGNWNLDGMKFAERWWFA
jgi:peptide/nickel transport system substrate-binding protein